MSQSWSIWPLLSKLPVTTWSGNAADGTDATSTAAWAEPPDSTISSITTPLTVTLAASMCDAGPGVKPTPAPGNSGTSWQFRLVWTRPGMQSWSANVSTTSTSTPSDLVWPMSMSSTWIGASEPTCPTQPADTSCENC